MSDKFRQVIRAFTDLDKKKMRELRRLLLPIAEDFNNEVIRWLETKNYPLRRGGLSAQPADSRTEYDGRTATERLHGERTLAAAQYVRLRKKRGENTLNIVFLNAAEHAQYFFPEINEHTIPGNPKLVYWAGDPMAWHPPYGATLTDDAGNPIDDDMIAGGIRKRDRVDHPGHEAFEEYVWRRWQKRGFSRRVREAYEQVMNVVIKGIRNEL